mgnify:FL=1
MCSVPGKRMRLTLANSTQSRKKQSYQSTSSHRPYAYRKPVLKSVAPAASANAVRMDKASNTAKPFFKNTGALSTSVGMRSWVSKYFS